MNLKKILNMNPGITRREASIRLSSEGVPSSLNMENRSVQVVAATEEPAWVFNPETFRMEREILLMSGMRTDGPEQIPLLDSHDRWSTQSVIGSARDFEIEGGQLLSRTYFSSVDAAEEVFTKVREGHLTDVSIGYTVHAHVRVKDGETAEVAGREFEGPVLVAVDWSRKELSWCPIGADENAKARQAAGKKENVMPPEKLEELRRRFNMPDATEDEILAEMEKRAFAAEDGAVESRSEPAPAAPQAPAPAAPPAPAAAPEGGDFSRSDAAEIAAVCTKFGMSERAADFIANGTGVPEVYKICSDEYLGRAQQQDYPAPRIESGPTERDKFRQAGENAILARCGHEVDHNEMGGLGGYSMVELCRHAVQLVGGNPSGFPTDIVGRALTTSDLPLLLDSVANRLLLAGFDEEESTHEVWCDTSGVLTDYRPKRLIRPGEISSLREVPEGGEYHYATLGEEGETVILAKFGELFRMTRETLINDDLDALSSIGSEMGAAAKRTVADLPYAVLSANELMGDGKALFHADRGNFVSPGSLIGTESLTAGELAMSSQKDIGGKRRLNIQPRFLLAGLSSKGAAEQFFNTTLIGGKTDQPNLVNVWGGDKLTRVYDGRIDDFNAKGWFLAGPKGKTVKLFFLNGNKKPFTESRNGWTIDGIEKKVRIEVVAKAISAQALSYNVGPAS